MDLFIYTFPFKMYMPTKKSLKQKGYKIMYNGSNFDRKSQLSEILTEPLNPRDPLHLKKGLNLNLNFKDKVLRNFHLSLTV